MATATGTTTPASGAAPEAIIFPSTQSRKHPTKLMHALEWHGTKDVRLVQRAVPMITDSTDVIVRVTATTICGSDLHLFHNEFVGMEKSDVLGHEFVGIIEEVGPEVKNLSVGDRVAVSAVIACGKCMYCQKGLYSNCDRTNPSKLMEKTYGHRTAGLFGYSHLTGGYEGGQAEYARVPIADVNCLKLPAAVSDEKALMLCDVACTSYMGADYAEIGPGKSETVAIWGAGPVGLLTAQWAKYLGAKTIIVIDPHAYRLDMARRIAGAITIDITEVTDVVKRIAEIIPNGPDAVIDCAGFRFPKGITHKLQRLLRLETDAPDILTECIQSVRKGGIVSVIGDYYKTVNNFPIGAFMEKGLRMRGSQVHVQHYWDIVLPIIQSGKFDPTSIITHRLALDRIVEAYDLFDNARDGAVKIVLKPPYRVA